MSEAAPRLGGLVEFYRSPAREAWTPTGVNVPDYPRLALLWWTRIADAVAAPILRWSGQSRRRPGRVLGRLQAQT
jgi:hypothetical protein